MRFMAPLVAVVLLTFSRAASAQPVVGSLTALQARLPAGSAVVLTDRDGVHVKGTVVSVGPDGLELAIRTAVRRFAEADIALIERRSTDNLLNGTAIGAGVGAGSALAIFIVLCQSGEECGNVAEGFAAYALIGGLIGLTVDATVRPLRPIYINGLRTSARRPEWVLSPVAGRRTFGAAVAVAF